MSSATDQISYISALIVIFFVTLAVIFFVLKPRPSRPQVQEHRPTHRQSVSSDEPLVSDSSAPPAYRQINGNEESEYEMDVLNSSGARTARD
jgi:hypothetical protein